jgi:hypothetical protein
MNLPHRKRAMLLIKRTTALRDYTSIKGVPVTTESATHIHAPTHHGCQARQHKENETLGNTHVFVHGVKRTVATLLTVPERQQSALCVIHHRQFVRAAYITCKTRAVAPWWMCVCVCTLIPALYLLIRSSVLFHFTGKCDISILQTYFQPLDLKLA